MLSRRVLCLAIAGLLMASPGMAQQKGPFGGFKHDRTAPIEITANALEVKQAEQLAIFSGEVIAGQGTLRLTADRVEVIYDENNSDNSETGAIKNMQAKGNVFISNGAETAQGERAEYDVDAGKITMVGAVVLTQGNNAMSGQTLVINLNTGEGKIEGRVSGIFTPKKAENAAAAGPTVCNEEQRAGAAALKIHCIPLSASN